MTILSDGDIIHYQKYGLITIDPFVEDNVQPASVDLRLGDSVIPFSPRIHNFVIDPQNVKTDKIYEAPQPTTDGYVLQSGCCILADTIEYISVPDTLQVDVHGRSSLGRLALLVHISAGYVDPGFDGTVTLEIVNMGPNDILLRYGMRIAQISFNQLTNPVIRPYGPERGSKYKGQKGPTTSRLDQDREVVRGSLS